MHGGRNHEIRDLWSDGALASNKKKRKINFHGDMIS
jgi:hypothetical protein